MEGTLVKIRADVVTEGALVITCFPSVGMVSSVVGHYLIDNLDLEFVGGVVDPRLPPLTLVTDGKPMPIIRAYAGKPECSIEGCDKIILLMSELVIPSPFVHDIVCALVPQFLSFHQARLSRKHQPKFPFESLIPSTSRTVPKRCHEPMDSV